MTDHLLGMKEVPAKGGLAVVRAHAWCCIMPW